MNEDDGLFGPETDLIISLIALLLVTFLFMTTLYMDASDIARLFGIKNDTSSSKINEDNELRDKYRKLIYEYNKLSGELKKIPKKPLIIPLKEESGFKFESGKSDLSPYFKLSFKENIIPQIKSLIERYDVDLIEVIGHTDGQPISQCKTGNLDNKLLNFTLISPQNINSITSCSNADLGLVRSLAVATFINDELKQTDISSLHNVKFRVYSAANLISPISNLIEAADDIDNRNRRRIELRFTKQSIITNSEN